MLIFNDAALHLGLQPVVAPGKVVAQYPQLKLRADSCQQYVGLDGFGEVIDSTQCQSTLLVIFGIQCRDKNNRDVAGFRDFPEFSEHLITVHLGHHDIEQDQRWPRLKFCHSQCHQAGVCNAHSHGKPLQ